MVSAYTGDGLAEAWAEMQALVGWRRETGHWDRRRAEQALYWFRQEVRQALLARLDTPQARAAMAALSDRVASGALSPAGAASEMLEKHLGG